MSVRGALGWVILAVALAVPAFMFYNWWQALNSKGPEMRRKASPGEAVFGGKVSVATRLPNPVAAGTAAAAPQDSQAAAPSASAVPAGSSPAGAATQPPPQTAAQPTATPASSAPASAEPAGSAGPDQAPAASSTEPAAAAAKPGEASLEFNPKSTRDPTISPIDVKRIAQRELERELARMQVKKVVAKKRHVPKEPPIETRILLSGIVATQGDRTAIVNGGIVHEGDVVSVGTSRVRIRRITTSTVTFEHKARLFSKTMSK